MTTGGGHRLRHQLDPPAGRRPARPPAAGAADRPDPPDGDRPARPGRRPDRPARAGGDRAHPGGAGRLRRPRSRELGAERVRMVRHQRHPRRRQRGRLPGHGAWRPSASRRRWSPATRRPGSPSPARCAACRPTPSRRTWWSTSAAARPSSWSATAPAVRARRSRVDIGCVRMTERHLHGDPPTAGRRSPRPRPTSPPRSTGRCAAVPGREAAHPGRPRRLGHHGGRHRAGPDRRTTRSASTTPGSPYDEVARGDRRPAGDDPRRSGWRSR